MPAFALCACWCAIMAGYFLKSFNRRSPPGSSICLPWGRVRDASVSVVGLEATVQVGTVTVNKRPRGRPPGRSSRAADLVDEYMAAGYSQPEARRQAAEDLRLALRTVKRRHQQSPKRRWDKEADVT